MRLMRTGAVGAVAVAAITAALSIAPPTAQAVSYTPGTAGVGDPYFPLLGNGGFDVQHYDLHLKYAPSQHLLSGTVTVTAKATQNLSRFDLDLSGMQVHDITVDGTEATYTRGDVELRITPAQGLDKGSTFVTKIKYDGSPRTITGSPIVFGADYGWQYTPDGAFVGDEPNAAHTWFPSSDHPSDKASYTFDITAPSDVQVVANGELAAQRQLAGTTEWVWNETSPMATYLATIDIGKWVFNQSTTPGGIPETVAYDPDLAQQVEQQQVIQHTADITDFWSQQFGPYAFSSTGAIVDNVPNVGFSLETQTRPLYGFAPDPITTAHELSHEWFGDSVSVADWSNIWLNEGFATFSQWYWNEHLGGSSTFVHAQAMYNTTSATSPFWDQSIANPHRDTMFSSAVYNRGGMTLAALRHLIGDTKFFTLLQTWTQQHKYGNATTAQFEALAQQVSGIDLSRFFKLWLVNKTKPPKFTAH
jgi:aminopeptidase N